MNLFKWLEEYIMNDNEISEPVIKIINSLKTNFEEDWVVTVNPNTYGDQELLHFGGLFLAVSMINSTCPKVRTGYGSKFKLEFTDIEESKLAKIIVPKIRTQINVARKQKEQELSDNKRKFLQEFGHEKVIDKLKGI